MGGRVGRKTISVAFGLGFVEEGESETLRRGKEGRVADARKDGVAEGNVVSAGKTSAVEEMILWMRGSESEQILTRQVEVVNGEGQDREGVWSGGEQGSEMGGEVGLAGSDLA
jgi:hypothetical protein